MSTTQRKEYYQERTKKIITFEAPSQDLKKKLKAAAKSDGRTISGWISHHVMPIMEELIEKQTGRGPGKH